MNIPGRAWSLTSLMALWVGGFCVTTGLAKIYQTFFMDQGHTPAQWRYIEARDEGLVPSYMTEEQFIQREREEPYFYVRGDVRDE